MKMYFLTSLILLSASIGSWSIAAEKTGDEWQATALSDATIKKVQEGIYEHKKCISEQMKKPDYAKMDSRNATDAIIKQCEPALSKIRETYLADKVPATVADRHLKQIRIQVTRKALQGMMFSEAARKAGQP